MLIQAAVAETRGGPFELREFELDEPRGDEVLVPLRGIMPGDSVPQLFISILIEMYRSEVFPFERLVQLYEFDEISEAVADMQSGKTVKPILRIGTTD